MTFVRAALFVSLFLITFAGRLRSDTVSEWKTESDSKGVTIESRAHESSSMREFRAVGVIEAPTSRVFAVLNDAETYPAFMPYVSQCRVLQRHQESVIVYQRLAVPLVSDRDYTLRNRFENWPSEAGRVYRIRWAPANELGPPPAAGVLRISRCEGGWLLEPQGKTATRATYSIYTESGGHLPAYLENTGSRIAIRKIYEAIRKQVKDPKYAAAE